MSLDNIQLPAIVIQDLFKNSLIDSKNKYIKSDLSNISNISFLGENKKQIIVLIDEENQPFLSTDDLNFLMEILTACKLSLSDIAIVNMTKNKALTYETIQSQFKATVIIAFGLSTNDIALPLTFPTYQLQQYNQINYLFAPALQLIKANKEEKKALWASLQKLFF